MNSKRKFSNRAMPAVLAALAALALSQQALAEDKHIDVTVKMEDGSYKLDFLNSECPAQPNYKGCIRAERNSSPNISWKLDDASKDDWELTRLRLSPDGLHWGDPNNPLEPCTVSDFNLSAADAASGWATNASVLGNGQRLQIKDENNNVCTTHYRIFARPKAGGDEIDSDPIIDNRGRD